MDKIPFSQFFQFRGVPDHMIQTVFTEFAYHKTTHFVFPSVWAERILTDSRFYSFLLDITGDLGITFRDMHSPFGPMLDLNCGSPTRRPRMMADHKLAMAFAAEMGCKTYTMHIGAHVSYHPPVPSREELRRLEFDTLETLVPEAEKLGITIAVENSFEPTNTVADVLKLLREFNTPALGCCFDSGHANLKEARPGKEMSLYACYILDAWNQNVIQDHDILKQLAPYIVTCHLHDNNGYADLHQLPGKGNIDWNSLVSAIKNQCPRLLSLQSEVENGYPPIAEQCRTFREFFPDCEH